MPQQFTNFHSKLYIYRQSQRIYSPISPIYHKAHKPSLIYQSCTHTPIRQGSGYLDAVTKGYHSRRIFPAINLTQVTLYTTITHKIAL